MSDLELAFSYDNLLKAWKWLLSNPDGRYKNYFRDSYTAYALSEISNLTNLSRNLNNCTYHPCRSIKIYLPKPSGLLRSYSLLCVEDQIVYQAIINVIAEKLFKRNNKFFYDKCYGHIYAGKKSKFFYEKWESSYKKFTDSIIKANKDGFDYIADFDLTAFYDSIDHYVLENFLIEKFKVQKELVEKLSCYLNIWTSNDNNIFHKHGIPQGPLPSGLLAECLLCHFDEEFVNRKNIIKYYRYVDDIKLFAKDESYLRQGLVDLDLLSKQIGLFPQSNKVNVHKIQDILSEVKNISRTQDRYFLYEDVSQKRLRKRINEITKYYKIQNETLFKFLIAQAKPTKELNKRVIKLLSLYPHLYENISFYLFRNKSKKIDKDSSLKLLELIKASKPYPSKISHLLFNLKDSIHEEVMDKFIIYSLNLWLNKDKENIYSFKHVTADLESALASWLIPSGKFLYKDIDKLLKNQEDWFFIKDLIKYVDIDVIGKPSYQELINKLLKSTTNEIALNATYYIVKNNLKIEIPKDSINELSQVCFKEIGMINQINYNYDLISRNINKMLIYSNHKLERKNWNKFLGKDFYKKIVQDSNMLVASFKTNVSEWVNLMDSFNDLILYCLAQKKEFNYELGNMGSSIYTSNVLKSSFPAFQAFCIKIHDLRRSSYLSHSVIKEGKDIKGLTTYIKYTRVHNKKLNDQLYFAYKEIINIL